MEETREEKAEAIEVSFGSIQAAYMVLLQSYLDYGISFAETMPETAGNLQVFTEFFRQASEAYRLFAKKEPHGNEAQEEIIEHINDLYERFCKLSNATQESRLRP